MLQARSLPGASLAATSRPKSCHLPGRYVRAPRRENQLRRLAGHHPLRSTWRQPWLRFCLPLLCSAPRDLWKRLARRGFLLRSAAFLFFCLSFAGSAVASTGGDPISAIQRWAVPLANVLPDAGCQDVLLLLLATTAVVPFIKQLKTSPILGFLLIGLLLGPSGFHIIENVELVDKLAELGIVFFLFETGLELSVKKVISMRADVFGLGTAQFMGTALLIASLAKLFLPSLKTGALVVFGGGLALSSSAFVLQLLRDGGELGTRYGRASFGVLLFQDLIVVPLLVVVPLLAGGSSSSLSTALWSAFVKAIFSILLICGAGTVLLRRVFSYVRKSRSDEAFLAATLAVVLLCSTLTKAMGLSDTLGAFVGGVLVAETDYRHLVESNIAPFRGLLLGLFFITVGFSLDLRFFASSWTIILPLLLGLLILKVSVVMFASWAFNVSGPSALQSGLLLAPGGEFAFVLFGLAERLSLISGLSSKLLVTTTVLSMALTPVLASVGAKVAARQRSSRGEENLAGLDKRAKADIAKIESDNFVVLCGWNTLTRTICDLLDAEGSKYIVLEDNQVTASRARDRGLPVYLADCARRETLQQFNVSGARLLVVTSMMRQVSDRQADCIRRFCPDLPMLVRAEDPGHKEQLQNRLGVVAVVPALVSFRFGGNVLKQLGYPHEEIESIIEEQRRKAVALRAADFQDGDTDLDTDDL